MAKSARIVALLIVIVVAVAFSARIHPKLRLCHEIECPPEAVDCTKTVAASDDNKKLITTFVCGGSAGDVLLSKVNEKDNTQFADKAYQPYKITKQFLML